MDSQARQDQRHMLEAIQLAWGSRLLAPPNPWVGCILVKNNKVIGRGATQPPGQSHAEAMALQDAGPAAQSATAYVTLEPCSHHGRTPPCCDALIRAGVSRVVVALQDPDPKVAGQGLQRLKAAGVEVELGCCAELVEQQLRPYLHHRRQCSAYCILKAATSVDGRLAAADGSSQWITGPEARRDVHRLRAESGAIMVASGTVLIDRPRLTVRDIDPMPPQPPLRVLLDGRGKVPAEGPLFDTSLGPVLVYTSEHCSTAARLAWEAAGAQVELVSSLEEQDHILLDIAAVLKSLAQRGILQVLVEGGARLSHQIIAQQLAQEFRLYLGPLFLGDAGLPLLAGPGPKTLSEAYTLQLQDCCRLGDSVRLIYTQT